MKIGLKFVLKAVVSSVLFIGSPQFLLSAGGGHSPVFGKKEHKLRMVVGNDVRIRLPWATDPDGDPITYGIDSLPPGLSFDRLTRIIKGRPSKAGIFKCSYVAKNAHEKFAQMPVVISLMPIDDGGSLLEPNFVEITNPSGPISIYVGQSVTFEAISDGGKTPRWTFGDATLASGFSSTHVFQAAGNYSVRFNVLSDGIYSAGSATVGITVSTPPPVGTITSISVKPNPATITAGSSQAFTATVSGTGGYSSGVTWSLVSGTGNINPSSGVYTSGAAGSATVKATSTQDGTKYGMATVTVNPLVGITVNPSSVTLQTGQWQAMAAAVTGTPNTGVNWAATGGRLSAVTGNNVVWYAPEIAGTYSVTATSQADPAKTARATLTVNAAGFMSMSPTSASLGVGQAQIFTAMVQGSANTAVTWTSTGGTLSATTGASITWTAPMNTGAYFGTYSLTATSQADASKSIIATITVGAADAFVSVSPAKVGLYPGQAQVFTAMVQGTANTAVTWAANAGTLSATTGPSITWTAPMNGGNYQLWVSSPESQIGATARISVPWSAKVQVKPWDSGILPGEALVLNASLTSPSGDSFPSDTGFSWRASAGTLSATTGTSVVWTAPRPATTPVIYTVYATSQADISKVGATQIKVVGEISITASSSAVSIQTGASSEISAIVTSTSNPGVSWSATGGTLSASSGSKVTWTAPETPGTYTLTATSQADPTKSANVTINVWAGVAIALTPSASSVVVGRSQIFTATISNTSNTNVSWAVSGGTLSATTGGTVAWTAPALPGRTFTVTATPQANPYKYATATVLVDSGIAVGINPSSASVGGGQVQALTATVTGTANSIVIWNANGGTLSAAAGGTVNWTAPATAGTYTVTATSQEDQTKVAIATMTVSGGILISATPRSSAMLAGGTLSLRATVTGSTNTAVAWRATGGTLSATSGGTVIWIAPAVAGTYLVTATSQADPTKGVVITVRVSPPVCTP